MSEYILIVCKDIEDSRKILSEMKVKEDHPLIKDTVSYYITEGNKKVKAICEGMKLCGLQYKGKRPNKAIIYGYVNGEWMDCFLLPALRMTGREIVHIN